MTNKHLGYLLHSSNETYNNNKQPTTYNLQPSPPTTNQPTPQNAIARAGKRIINNHYPLLSTPSTPSTPDTPLPPQDPGKGTTDNSVRNMSFLFFQMYTHTNTHTNIFLYIFISKHYICMYSQAYMYVSGCAFVFVRYTGPIYTVLIFFELPRIYIHFTDDLFLLVHFNRKH